MGYAPPQQHPAVVLRSHYSHVRGLLVMALVALVSLSGAVVILANDRDDVSGTTSATSVESTTQAPGIRFDGGPDEGTRGNVGQPAGIRFDGGPDEGTRGNVAQAAGIRFDGGPDEGTRGNGSPQASSDQSAIVAQAPGIRFDGGPDEGTRGNVAQAAGIRFDGGPDEGTRGTD